MKSFVFWIVIFNITLIPPLQGKPVNVRVVDFGADMSGFTNNFYRGEPRESSSAGRIKPVLDLDGDGSLENDSVSGWEFSLTEPLNFPFAPQYDLAQKNARLYGGLMIHAVNNPNRVISEGLLNANHEFRDDFNFMGLGRGETPPEESLEATAVWFWQKADFLNGGDVARVFFDENSQITVHISRYWGGLHRGRWLVRDGDQFYLSEATIGGVDELIDAESTFAEFGGKHPLLRKSHSQAPAETRWARFDPKEREGDRHSLLQFEPGEGAFLPHDFQDVTAVGFYVRRDFAPATAAVAGGLPGRQPLAMKWYAFRCDARVDHPETAAWHVPMTRVTLPDGGSDLFMGTGEVSFRQWELIRRLVVTNQYCRGLGNLGYSFLRDGSVGSMRVVARPHTTDEPVTDITWLDAVAWCNALSEVEGLEPAYYADPEHRQVLRRLINRDAMEAVGDRPTVYWKREAQGFRLPTISEISDLNEVTEETTTARAEGTNPVLAGERDNHGLYHLMGNVWEWVWPAEMNSVEPEALKKFPAMGRGFLTGADGTEGNPFPFELRPAEGFPAIGFRVARNASGGGVTGGAVPSGRNSDVWWVGADYVLESQSPQDRQDLANWVSRNYPMLTHPTAGKVTQADFDSFDVIRRKSAVDRAANHKFLKKITEEEFEQIKAENVILENRPAYPLEVGVGEVPYSVWNIVRGWAETQGYRFNYAGDMGSLRYGYIQERVHDPQEPVTYISWHDALVWANALSELFQLEPVYFTNEDASAVYRQVLPFRLDTYQGEGYPALPGDVAEKLGAGVKPKPDTASGIALYFAGTRNGFRLPMTVEFAEFAPLPLKSAEVLKEEVVAETSDGGTRPVQTHGAAEGEEALALQQLHGNVLEWAWDPQGNYLNFMGTYPLNGFGAFTMPAESVAKNRRAYQEFPANARPYFGFRIVRNAVSINALDEEAN